MDSATGTALAVGKVLVAVGLLALVLGTATTATRDCEPTYSLVVTDPDAGDGDASDPAEAVAFGNLSPVEQRIFLEAYTDEHDTSRRYEEWDPSWFEEVRAVTYRGRRYGVVTGHGDCAPTPWGRLLQVGGVAVGFVGLSLSVPAYAWRRHSA